MPTRIALVVLAALLTALPLAQTASPVEAKKRPRTITTSFGSPTNILIQTSATSPASADPYPSPIVVSGLKGTIRDVNLRLNGLKHSYVDEVEVLLVGPRGQTAIVMANVGHFNTTPDLVTLTLDDEAGALMPDATTLQSGAYRPTVGFGPVAPFAAPAPNPSANTELAVFDNGDPNGTWQLFVQDEYGFSDQGAITGGWDLEITTKAKGKKKKR